MKEYTVYKVCCEKGRTISDIVVLIAREVVYHHVFFELSHISQPARQALDSLSEFFHSVEVHDHNNNVYDAFSNLNENWTWANPKVTRSLTPQELQDLIRYADNAGTSKYWGLLLGFDGIEWEQGCISTGTFGYKKARNHFGGGYNYLSNSIIIFKDNTSRSTCCYVACESKYREASNLKKMLGALGKLVDERTYFAPDDAAERQDWERRYRKAERDYAEMRGSLSQLVQSLPSYQRKLAQRKENDYSVEKAIQAERDAPTLNTKKISSLVLQAKGWQKAKAKNFAISYEKKAGDGTLMTIIVSTHRGHMVQALLKYYSESFLIEDNTGFSRELLTVTESEEYFHDLAYVLEYIVSFLNNRSSAPEVGQEPSSHE